MAVILCVSIRPSTRRSGFRLKDQPLVRRDVLPLLLKNSPEIDVELDADDELEASVFLTDEEIAKIDEEVAPPTFESVGRTWTSADGKFMIKAKFVKFEAGNVFLEKEDGKVVDLSIGNLSAEDQQWVRDELKRRQDGA